MGNNIKEFILDNLIEDMNKVFNKLIMVIADDKPSLNEIMTYYDVTDPSVSNGDDWYSVLRRLQGNLQAYIDNPEYQHMIDVEDFMKESLFYEWAYIINLDKNVLEIYQGFQKEPQHNRYFTENSDDGYYNIALIKEIDFKSLKDFNMEDLEKE